MPVYFDVLQIIPFIIAGISLVVIIIAVIFAFSLDKKKAEKPADSIDLTLDAAAEEREITPAETIDDEYAKIIITQSPEEKMKNRIRDISNTNPELVAKLLSELNK